GGGGGRVRGGGGDGPGGGGGDEPGGGRRPPPAFRPPRSRVANRAHAAEERPRLPAVPSSGANSGGASHNAASRNGGHATNRSGASVSSDGAPARHCRRLRSARATPLPPSPELRPHAAQKPPRCPIRTGGSTIFS